MASYAREANAYKEQLNKADADRDNLRQQREMLSTENAVLKEQLKRQPLARAGVGLGIGLLGFGLNVIDQPYGWGIMIAGAIFAIFGWFTGRK